MKPTLSMPRNAPVRASSVNCETSRAAPMWLMRMRDGGSPAAVNAARCHAPCSTAEVCVTTAAPVASAACAAASNTRAAGSPMSPRGVPTLMTPARMVVSPIPLLISVIRMSRNAATEESNTTCG